MRHETQPLLLKNSFSFSDFLSGRASNSQVEINAYDAETFEQLQQTAIDHCRAQLETLQKIHCQLNGVAQEDIVFYIVRQLPEAASEIPFSTICIAQDDTNKKFTARWKNIENEITTCSLDNLPYDLEKTLASEVGALRLDQNRTFVHAFFEGSHKEMIEKCGYPIFDGLRDNSEVVSVRAYATEISSAIDDYKKINKALGMPQKKEALVKLIQTENNLLKKSVFQDTLSSAKPDDLVSDKQYTRLIKDTRTFYERTKQFASNVVTTLFFSATTIALAALTLASMALIVPPFTCGAQPTFVCFWNLTAISALKTVESAKRAFNAVHETNTQKEKRMADIALAQNRIGIINHQIALFKEKHKNLETKRSIEKKAFFS